ncbi:MAG: Jag N-terminal domain-containing protein [Desulfovibrio sp.]|jgi:spoIIIJ-associated protein|nr:Jag N-terminal domain-containing protein [Desulfovibrio sp.]
MDSFKEFQGKDLDSAISEACDYFNLAREKLEIEIVQDAKSGIFGIVGARKARVRARRAQLPNSFKNLLGKGGDRQSSVLGLGESGTDMPGPDAPGTDMGKVEAQPSSGRRKRAGKDANRQTQPDALPARPDARSVAGMDDVAESREMDADDVCAPVDEPDDFQPDAASDVLSDASLRPLADLTETDAGRAGDIVSEAGARIVAAIIGRTPEVTAETGRDRVRLKVDCGQDSGLLIGREGQTLAALQYLLTRIVSRRLDAAVRVQVDAGDYRQKQEDKLREMALALAERARRSGRGVSTRPLSSYHRRIVHLCLQNVSDIQTRSTGEGPLKRVVIQRQKVEK